MAKQTKKSAAKQPAASKRTAKKSAAKKASAKTSAGRGAGPEEAEGRLIEAAFRLAAEHGWRHVSLAEIAAEAGVPLSAALPAYASKTALLRGFIRRIDRQMLAALGDGDAGGDGPRDRLFDIMMARFDVLVPYRDGLAAILKDTVCDPLASLCLLPTTRNSLAWMLESAGIPTGGPRGALRVKGLGLVYADAMRAFLRDESEDLAKTMARLDTALKRAERAAGLLGWRRSSEDSAAA
jgi:AcrR family transcriptional regulator